MDSRTASVIGGIYHAICAALSDEGVELANDILVRLADDPKTNPTDAFVWRSIAESATGETHERPRLELITGGAA